MTLPTFQGGAYSTSVGDEIWKLLRVLTDAALERLLVELRQSAHYQVPNQHLHQVHGNNDNKKYSQDILGRVEEGEESDASSSTVSALTGSNSLDNNPNRDIIETSTTTSTINIPQSGHLGLNRLQLYTVNESSSRDLLLSSLHERVVAVTGLFLSFQAERSDWAAYLAELDRRLAEARKTIKLTEQRLYELHLEDEHHFLYPELLHTLHHAAAPVGGTVVGAGPAGAHKGSSGMSTLRMIRRLMEQRELLQSFLDSPLLKDVNKHLEEEEQKEKDAAVKATEDAALDGMTKKKLTSVNAKNRRRIMTKEEIEAFKISMRDAITNLVSKIEEVCSMT